MICLSVTFLFSQLFYRPPFSCGLFLFAVSMSSDSLFSLSLYGKAQKTFKIQREKCQKWHSKCCRSEATKKTIFPWKHHFSFENEWLLENIHLLLRLTLITSYLFGLCCWVFFFFAQLPLSKEDVERLIFRSLFVLFFVFFFSFDSKMKRTQHLNSKLVLIWCTAKY